MVTNTERPHPRSAGAHVRQGEALRLVAPRIASSAALRSASLLLGQIGAAFGFR